ncbi:MAG: hypothetical protein M3176_07150 [Chloroflexota bacterium]|nr:hypothetical protein [Chloroflexota bacterium]
MAAQRPMETEAQEQDGRGKTLKRRGLMAAAAALVAGIAAKQTSQPVGATSYQNQFVATGNTDDGVNPADFMAGGTQTYGLDTTLGTFTYGVHGKGNVYGVWGESTNGVGVYANSTNGAGVSGTSQASAGVVGTSSASNVAGVKGFNSDAGATSIGVQGDVGTTGIGVLGGRKGVSGRPFNGSGVQGLADGGYGVNGDAATGRGVNGSSDSGYGVYGASGGGVGVGVNGTGNVAGVQGLGGGDTSTNTTGFPMGVRGSVPNTGYGVYGRAGNGTGVTGAATGTGGNGVNGTAIGGNGVVGQSTSGLGGSFQGGTAPIRLVPGAQSARTLAVSGHQAGELYMTSDNRLFLFDGSNWREVLLAAPGSALPPAPAARPSAAGSPQGTVQPAPAPRP